MKNKLRISWLPILGVIALAALVSIMHGLTEPLACLGLLAAAGPLVLTEEQLAEFRNLLTGIKEYSGMFPALRDLGTVEGGFAAIKQLPTTLKELVREREQLAADLKRVQKTLLSRDTGSGVRWIGDQPFVSEDCARALAGLYIIAGVQQNKLGTLVRDTATRERLLGLACDALGLEQRAALSSSDIPVPTIYVPQVIELIWHYGQFRQFATVFPLGAPTVNLPQLKAGEDAFVFLAASAAVSERKVAAQNVTFTAHKAGGVLRIPTEIEEDTYIPLGQFLARYISRRFAHLEDETGFLGDGGSSFATITGVGPYIAGISQTPNLTQLASGKTKPSDATVADWRSIRAKVNAAALGHAAYYCHPSMEALLVSFNTINSPLIYQRAQGGQPATLDGFPIRWCGIMQPYSTAAAAGKFLAFFGDLSYWYLGERGQPRLETSREVYFATDEVGLRALERIDVQAMAPDAMSALQTAAS
jgi:HK97 family phage major capsid protein